MRPAILFGLIVACAILASCKMVRSNVTTFHELSTPPKLTKYSFYSLDGQETLEHRSYLNLVTEELVRYGYEEVPIEYSEVIIVLTYGIDDGKTVSGNVPIWGQTGTSSSTTTGQINTYGNYGTYSGTTTYTPTYGVTGYASQSGTSYKRQVSLNFYDAASVRQGAPKTILETRAVSSGSSADISMVMSSIVEAMFKEFPGESGKARKVTVKMKQ